MLKLKSLLKSNLFIFVVAIAFFAVCPQDAFAASGSVFEKVRDKAASSLKDIKLVVYILAGFGLIGFSFMAIFNKISWKWFANIAISLFLLSVMGLFIDDFTGTSKHSTMLDYGNYLTEDDDRGYSPEFSETHPNKDPLPACTGDDCPKEEKGSECAEPCYNADCQGFSDPNCVSVRNLSGKNAEKCTAAGGILSGDQCMKTDGSGSIPVEELWTTGGG
ncbi:MAG: TrbC/VirB2 family protein [Alphaproteobacteria bacterium]|nr:TrbC/VirB2 family protein [Alphaproteobacteria bacterium]